MNEEELFCKQFPEYVVNGKPLSPYFDLFESGYEQAENRYEGLEKENAELKHQLNKNPCVCNTEWHCNDCLERLTKAKQIIQEFLELNYSEFTKTNAVFLHADKFLKE